MSPEQAPGRGARHPDRPLLPRGGALRDGHGPPRFRGSTTAVIFDAILHKAPTAPVRLNPEVPPSWSGSSTSAWRRTRTCGTRRVGAAGGPEAVERDGSSAKSTTAESEAVETLSPPTGRSWTRLAAAARSRWLRRWRCGNVERTGCDPRRPRSRSPSCPSSPRRDGRRRVLQHWPDRGHRHPAVPGSRISRWRPVCPPSLSRHRQEPA